MLAAIVDRVIEANSKISLDELQQMRETVMSRVPEDNRDFTRLSADFDSLIACYPLLTVRWDRFGELSDQYRDGLKDSVLSDDEITRLGVAVEKMRGRFIPEEIEIPYDALFGSEVTSIAALSQVLLVGSPDGLARYNGRNWQYLSTEDGLQSLRIECLAPIGAGSIAIGTDSGIAVFNGLTLNPLTTAEKRLPAGPVQAIGGPALNDLYAVVNGELYHFDGMQWRNTTEYAVVLDDTMERVAQKMSLYGSPIEQRRFIERYTTNERLKPTPAGASMSEPVTEEPVSADAMAVPEEATEVEEQPAESLDEGMEAAAETVTAGEETAAEGEPVEVADTDVMRAVPGIDTPLDAGMKIEVPYTTGIRGKVNSLFVDRNGVLWMGTQYGLFRFDGAGWTAPGYAEHVVTDGETIEDIAARCRRVRRPVRV